MPGELLYGRYRIERTLGEGAMGVVYLATDITTSDRVALKTVTANPQTAANPMEAMDYLARLKREAEITGLLVHPAIVALRHAGYDGDGNVQYLAMEYVEGESLESKLKRTPQLGFDEIHRIARDLLEAVSHAHTRGVVHRDIKPANILLTSTGRAKLGDFGIARPEESNLTVAGQVLGTPLYTAPENITGAPVTPKSDLFSIGAVVYEMIAGRKAFGGRKMQEILMSVVMNEPPSLPTLRGDTPPEWQVFVWRLLRKKPEERFPSAAAALQALPGGEEEEEGELLVGSTTYGSLKLPDLPGVSSPATPAAPEGERSVTRPPAPRPVPPAAPAPPAGLWARIRKLFGLG